MIDPRSAALAGAMMVAHPAWAAVAKFADAQRSGGIGRNKAQFLNFIVGIVTAVAVATRSGTALNSVLIVFGV